MKLFDLDPIYYDLESKLITKLNNYIKNNKCCDDKLCKHPEMQSNSYLFDEQDEIIQILKDSLYEGVKKLYTEYKVVTMDAWTLKRLKGDCNTGVWHNHKDEDRKILSSIFYVNDTNLGTEFEDENFIYKLKPKKFRWCIFDSKLNHRPENGYLSNDRYVISCDIGIKRT